MSVFTLEAGLALLGLVLLMIEAFKPDISRRTLGLTAIAGTANADLAGLSGVDIRIATPAAAPTSWWTAPRPPRTCRWT